MLLFTHFDYTSIRTILRECYSILKLSCVWNRHVQTHIALKSDLTV